MGSSDLEAGRARRPPRWRSPVAPAARRSFRRADRNAELRCVRRLANDVAQMLVYLSCCDLVTASGNGFGDITKTDGILFD